MNRQAQETNPSRAEVDADASEELLETAGPAERLGDVLERFRQNVDGVRGIAIADKSGLPVAAAFSTRANVLTVTAMATMAIQSSRRLYENLALAGPSEVVMAVRTRPSSSTRSARVSFP